MALVTVGAVFFGLNSQINWLMGQQLLLLVFAAVTLGGLGTDYGAMVGSLVIGIFTFIGDAGRRAGAEERRSAARDDRRS